MKRLLLCCFPLALVACAPPPEPICDREAQTYDKFGTPEDICERPRPRPVFVPRGGDDGDNPRYRDPDDKPTDEQPPRGEDPTPDNPDGPTPNDPPSGPKPPSSGGPKDKVKGNNGWGNGDQASPGRSGPRNNAENHEGGMKDGTRNGDRNSGKGSAAHKSKSKGEKK